MLSEGRYTARELQRVVPREVVMGSSLIAWVKKRSRAEGWAKGRAKGRAEGEVIAARSLCVDFVKQHHSGILSLVSPAIEQCPDAGLLHEWALAAPRSSDADFARLVKGETPSAASATGTRRSPSAFRATRGRAPRPSRRSKPSRRR
jgi:hypothetical protein